MEACSLKRVLIVCDSFPPQSDVGGLRPAMMAKYLPEFGWEPRVLTRDYGLDHACRDDSMHLDGMPPSEAVVRIELSAAEERAYLDKRSRVTKMRDFFQVERAHPPGMYDKVYQAAVRSIEPGEIDVVWATAPTYVPVRLGRDLARRFCVPWIADFRDIPEQESGMQRSWREHLLRYRSLVRRKQLVGTAARLMSVSPYHCDLLGRKLKRRCDLVYNGYDHNLFSSGPAQKTDRFRIVYTGRILNKWYQDPSLLFEALDCLIGQGCIEPADVDIVFYGTSEKILGDIIAPYRSAQLVRVLERVAYDDVPRVLKDASILLVLTNEGRHGILTTKLFECLAVGRSVLCVRARPQDDIAQLLRQTDAGVGTNSLEEVKAFVVHRYRQWKDAGKVALNSEARGIEAFSRRSQAGCMAQVLDEVAGRQHASDQQT